MRLLARIVQIGNWPYLLTTKMAELRQLPRPLQHSHVKIFRIIARLNVGGPARHVTWLTQALNNHEFKSVLVTGKVPDNERDMRYFAAENGVEPIYISALSRDLSIKDVISLQKIYREMRKFRPDIVHTHTGKAGTVGRIAALIYRWLTWETFIGRPRRIRIVHTFHGHFFHSYYGRITTYVFLLIERLLARIATDRIIVISRQQYDEIHKQFCVGRAEQFSVIPLGIDLRAVESTGDGGVLRDEIKAPDDEIVVGFVGRLTEIKDVSLYLQVAAEVKRQATAQRIRFVIAGDGHLRHDLEAQARELGLDARLVFLGNRPDVANVYAGLDIVSLTSFNEGTPLSLIEAMAARRPVISTLVGGVRDLLGDVTEHKAGFKVCERGIGIEGRSVEDYTKGLIYLIENIRLRKSLAEKGRGFVETQYSKDRLIHDIAQLYRTLTAEN